MNISKSKPKENIDKGISMNRNEFLALLEKNETTIVLFLNASWCKPCNTIKNYVLEKGRQSKLTFIPIDIDVNVDLYTALKAKKQVRGVPTLLAYKAKNVSLISDKSISGASIKDIDMFFNSL